MYAINASTPPRLNINPLQRPGARARASHHCPAAYRCTPPLLVLVAARWAGLRRLAVLALIYGLFAWHWPWAVVLFALTSPGSLTTLTLTEHAGKNVDLCLCVQKQEMLSPVGTSWERLFLGVCVLLGAFAGFIYIGLYGREHLVNKSYIDKQPWALSLARSASAAKH